METASILLCLAAILCAGGVTVRTSSAIKLRSIPTEIKWRPDNRCGPQFPLPNGDPSECNPLAGFPCCSSLFWCGNTDDHCDCPDCIDYRKWRSDRRCGPNFSLPNGGGVAQCNPNGELPCCNIDGWCGNTDDHCDCVGCLDFRRWRQDNKCGASYPLPATGEAAECNPHSDRTCCASSGICQATEEGSEEGSAEDTEEGTEEGTGKGCDCPGCAESRTWRADGRCGLNFLLANGEPSECNPDGDKPCCHSIEGWCVDGDSEYCFCAACVDFRRKKFPLE